MRRLDPITIPEDFWLRSTVIETLLQRDIGSLLTLVSTELSASQMRLGVAVGMDQNQVCRIMKGDVTVRHLEVFERIADGLAMPDRARLDLGLAPRAVAPATTPRPRSGGRPRPGAEMRPRSGPVTAVTPEEILAMAVSRARQFTTLAGQYVATEVIEQLHADVCQLATVYPRQPLTAILGDIADVQDAIFTVLEDRHRPDAARQLHLLAGAVSGMLAKGSHDVGDAHAALTHARTAFLCGERSDHNGLRAWARGLQSLITYWAGRPWDSLRHAQDGGRYAARSRSTTVVWLAVHEARARAVLGQAEGTREAIRRAEEASAHARPDELDDLGGICTFGRSRLLYYAADALAHLPDEAAEAQRCAHLAVEAYRDTSAPDWSFSDQAGSAAGLAIARLAGGDVEAAADAVAGVLDLPPAQRINGIVASLARLRAALGRAPASAARATLEQDIEAFARTPLAALPR